MEQAFYSRNIHCCFPDHLIMIHVKTSSGPNFIALLNGKQICVLTVAEKICVSLSVFHRLAEKLGDHITFLPWICIVTSFIFVR